jgi:hypothetical protein
LGTRIDDSTNKVTLVGTDKIPLGDGSFLPKHYTVDQIAEYAVSVASAAITSVNNQVSILGAARTSIGQAVSVNTAAITSINATISASTLTTAQGDARYLSTAEGSALVEAYGFGTLTTAQADTFYLSTSEGDARYMSTAETCALVEAYNYMVSVSNVSAGTYGTSNIIPQIVVGTNGVITDIIRVTAPTAGTLTTAEVCAIAEGYGFVSVALTTSQADDRYLSTAEGSALVEAYGYASVNYVSATYLTKASSSAFTKAADVSAIVEAYNYMVSVSNVSAGTYGTSTIIPQIVVGTNGVITDIIRVTAPAAGTLTTAEVCAVAEGYGFTSTNAVSTMISAAGIFAIVTVSTGRDLEMTDLGKYLRSEATSAVSMRVPTCASVAFPIGSVIYFRMGNTGKFSVSGAAGVSIQVPSSCSAEGRGQGATFSIVKYTSDTWDLTGDVSIK